MQHSEGFLKIVNDARTRVTEMTIPAYQERVRAGFDHLLVDVREESEWTGGHLPGAIHIGKGVIERDIETRVPDRNRTLVLYCGGGYRSALAADNLQKMGYSSVISLDGGFRGWKEAGLPVERG